MQLVLMEYLNSQTPVVVIPHGLDLDKFQEIDQIISRQDLGFTNQDVICIYVGRLSPEKNLSFLLQAFQTVLKTNPATRLLLVGDGPERKSLETQLKELGIFHHVLITGLVSHDDVPQYLSLGDIFVTPSPAESFGLSTLEAMSVGLPVLGIDAPGTRDLVENEINGLVANNQQSDFSEKLLRLTKDASLRRKLGAQAALSSRKYDIRVTTEALIQQYERLIEGTKRYDAVAA
jgi:glycosyltransferase involved in cell wall biosynthesis